MIFLGVKLQGKNFFLQNGDDSQMDFQKRIILTITLITRWSTCLKFSLIGFPFLVMVERGSLFRQKSGEYGGMLSTVGNLEHENTWRKKGVKRRSF